jgi:Mg-chelatase subunit ChlD
VEGERPDWQIFGQGIDFHFIFIVDRSGSMGDNGRMEIAIEALDLFIRSLPQGCKFSILSFGS